MKEYFGYGVSINEAFNFSKTRGDAALIRTMEKLPSYIKYVENEYGIEVLKQTAKKNNRRKQLFAA